VVGVDGALNGGGFGGGLCVRMLEESGAVGWTCRLSDSVCVCLTGWRTPDAIFSMICVAGKCLLVVEPSACPYSFLPVLAGGFLSFG
jgi:hypothetical protein